MAKTIMVPIIMTANEKGSLHGRWTMDCRAGEVYEVNKGLADTFMKMNVAAIYGGSTIPWTLRVNENKNTFAWGRQ